MKYLPIQPFSAIGFLRCVKTILRQKFTEAVYLNLLIVNTQFISGFTYTFTIARLIAVCNWRVLFGY